MPTFRERLGGVLQLMADRIAFGAAVPPTFNPPGVIQPWGWRNQNPGITKALNSVEALFGRSFTNAGPVHTRWSTYSATDLTPQKIGGALRQMDQGNPLPWMDMCEQALERDGHMSGLALTRAQAVSGSDWVLQSAAVPEEWTDLANSIRGFIEQCLLAIDGYDEATEHLLLANAFGYAAAEPVYGFAKVAFPGPHGETIRMEALVPKYLAALHGKLFKFEPSTGEPLIVMGGDLQRFPFGKVVFHRGEGTGPGPLVERRGYMRSTIWYHLGKQLGVEGWMSWLQTFGQPLVSGSYNGDLAQYPEFAAVYEQVLKGIGDGNRFLAPNDFKIDIKNPPTGGGGNDHFAALAGFCNTEITKRIAGAQLQVESGGNGSYAQASVHADVAYRRQLADARKLRHTERMDLFIPTLAFNQHALARALGFPPEVIVQCAPTRIVRIEREMSPEMRNKVFLDARNEGGLDIDETQYRNEMNLRAPPPGGRSIPGRLVAVPKGGAAVTVNAATADGGVKNPDNAAETAANAAAQTAAAQQSAPSSAPSRTP